MTIPPHFTTISVNTANPDDSSICQVGIALYFGDQVAEGLTTRIDPEDYFDPENVQAHGIDKEGVDGARNFREVAGSITRLIDDEIVVSYGPLARSAVKKAYQKANVPALNLRWIDCRNIARRTWPECFSSDYELSAVCHMLRHPYLPGDVLEDAKAIGVVFLQAIKDSGLSADAWVKLAAGNVVKRRVE